MKHNVGRWEPFTSLISTSLIDSLRGSFKYLISLMPLNELNDQKQHITELKKRMVVAISSEDSDFIGRYNYLL